MNTRLVVGVIISGLSGVVWGKALYSLLGNRLAWWVLALPGSFILGWGIVPAMMNVLWPE